MRIILMTTQVLDAIDGIAKSYDALKASNEKQFGSLSERVEAIEAQGDGDRPVKANGAAAEPKYQTFNAGSGAPIYQLPNTTKAVDVLPPEQKPEISLARWFGAFAAGDRCGDKEAVRYFKDTKSMTTGSTGMLIPAGFQAQWLDLLRANSVLQRAGAQTVLMDAKTLAAAAITSGPSVSWHSEAAATSPADAVFAARTLTAKTLFARASCSVEVSEDSPNFGQQIMRTFAAAMAAEIDRAGLEGSGGNQPQGILGTSGINQVTAVAAITNYSEMLSGVQKLLEANVDLATATRYAIMSPRTWAIYEALATGISSDLSQLARPVALRDTQFLVTTNVSNVQQSPAVHSTIYLGDFRDLIFGSRMQATVEILKLNSYSNNYMLEIVAAARCDFLVARPLSFCTLEGVH
jgi:HK97 family phage major capsid protein